MGEWTHPRIAAGTPTADRLLLIGWDVTGTRCWEWRGRISKFWGYGQIDIDRRTTQVHRLAYETWVGPIADGQVVMHSCDNPPCMNPMHLTLGTQLDNLRDRDAKGRQRNGNTDRTHCKRGHEFTPENTAPTASGGRRCRACSRLRKEGNA